MILKSADLGHACAPWAEHCRWSENILQELYDQVSRALTIFKQKSVQSVRARALRFCDVAVLNVGFFF